MVNPLDIKLIENTVGNQFFEEKSDEVRQILLKYINLIEEAEEQKPIKKLLDFSGGDGRFLHSLIASEAFYDGRKIEVSLIEPNRDMKSQLVDKLARLFDKKPILVSPDLSDLGSGYNLIMANNALFFFEKLREKVVKLVQALDYGGRLILTLKRFDHPLLNLLEVLSQHKGVAGPHNLAMQLFQVLYEYGFYYDTHDIHSVLRFQNTEENRTKIVLLALEANTSLYSEAIVSNFFDIHTYRDEVVIPLKDQIIVIHA